MARANVESPCIKVCAVDGTSGLCLGCGRTLKEIGGWMQFDDAGRRRIMNELPDRLDQIKSKGTMKVAT